MQAGIVDPAAERPEPNDQPCCRHVGLDAHGVAGDVLHEDAVDRQEQVVDAVDGKLEPRGDTADDEAWRRRGTPARGELEGRPRGTARLGDDGHVPVQPAVASRADASVSCIANTRSRRVISKMRRMGRPADDRNLSAARAQPLHRAEKHTERHRVDERRPERSTIRRSAPSSIAPRAPHAMQAQ
jgi:hypothetical protein